ncbi:MAG: SPOR domain-containing protein [Bacteriovoracaceae bacterium]|nr:SPOR domain-containing protein [Bacteriovoracaceae bacterium]
MIEDNSKLFVFEKKEVVLIFVFIVVIAVTAFTLGVRIGKRLSLKEDGYTKTDVQSIDLKSVDEEYVEAVVDDPVAPADFEDALSGQEAPTQESAADVEARLREEMEKLASGKVEQAPVQDDSVQEAPVEESSSVESVDSIQKPDDLYAPEQDVKGKFTIQLYANQSKAAAQDFADAFIVKGYDVIINEVSIAGKGNWYRVSIGVFDNIEDAKKYLQKESSLFQSEDYIIQQL